MARKNKKKDNKWKDFEVLIAKLQSELEPDAEIQHDHRVVGISGRTRQLDVTITKNVGLLSIFIVVECKRYKDKVEIGEVEEFSAKLKDVRAHQGIMVALSDFDDGARAVARQHNIQLISYREACDLDWNKLFDRQDWAKLFHFYHNNLTFYVMLDADSAIEVPPKTIVFDANNQHLFVLDEAFDQALCFQIPPETIGIFETLFETIEPFFIKINEKPQRVFGLLIRGTRIVREYTLNLRFISGHILEDVNQGHSYEKFVTEGFDWAEIFNTSPYKELTREEYHQRLSEPNATTAMFNPKVLQQYLRLEISRKHINEQDQNHTI